MFVVDTNILLYAADKNAPEHKVCRNLLEKWRGQTPVWYITWGIIYEFLRVVTHPRVFRNPWNINEAWKFIGALLASPSLHILAETDRHSETIREFLKDAPHVRGNLVFDMHTAILMKEHGVNKIYTRDADFHRFSFIQVIDPLQPAPRSKRR